MPITDLMPWNKDRGERSLQRKSDRDELADLREEMNQLFEGFFEEPFGMTPFSEGSPLKTSFSPDVDISETEKEITVDMELPGMDAEDIDLAFHGSTLTISGEKRTEKEEKGKQYYRKERSYGSFRRAIPLPTEIDEDGIEASFKRGVLHVHLPKTKEAQEQSKRIEIKTG